jgi:tetratricopeptide (TPR) repeat protein
VADTVARHLVAAGQIIDEDSELALKHALAARRLASRIAVVREAVGLAAYAAGDWTTAIAELRTYHRMSGKQTHLAELADCERALGRPERAIDLYRGADIKSLDKAGAIELLIVAAGARGDLGQHDAAVAMLQVKELTAEEDAEWAARLRYAYADALLAAGRRDEAREWFARTAVVDVDQLTDAAERLLELDGVTIEGDDQDDEDEADDVAPTDAVDVGDEDDEDDEPRDAFQDDAPATHAEDDEDDTEDDLSEDLKADADTAVVAESIPDGEDDDEDDDEDDEDGDEDGEDVPETTPAAAALEAADAQAARELAIDDADDEDEDEDEPKKSQA